MKVRVAVLVGLLLLGLFAGFSGADTQADSEARVLADLRFLAGDQCEGRGIQTKGIELAADYIAAQFRKAGLKPGGPDGSYFQPFTLVTSAKLGKANDLTLKGPLGQAITLEAAKHFNVALLGGSGRAEAPVVFAGYGITSTDPAYDDYAGLDVAGKVVVVLSGTPRRRHPYADIFAAAADGRLSPHASLRAKLENAERHQAAGVLIVNDQQTAALSRDALPRSFISPRDGAPSRLPVAHVRREQVSAMLVSATGLDLAQVEKQIDAGLKPQSVLLAGWTCRLATEVTHNKVVVKNVIGVLEGSGPLAKETVVVGAHYDHVGLGSGGAFGGIGGGVSPPGGVGGVGFPLTQMGKSSIHNGADDNASGTVAVLELARRLGATQGPPARRVVFIAFTAEETGLIGSAYYCRHPVFPLADTVAMINLDMVGRLQDDKLMVGGLGSAQPFAALIDRLNEKHRFDLLKDPSGQGPSDHSSFNVVKVPVLNLFTGFHEQYHRPSDKVETINVPGVRRIVDLMADLTTELRTTPTRPEYVKTGAFNRRNTLWSSAPSTGILPDYGDKQDGVLVGGVVESTPAAKAGLKKGDRLLALAGQPVKDPAGFLSLSRKLKAGDKVEVTVERDGQPQRLEMQLAKAPAGFPDRRFGFSTDFTDAKDGVLLTEVPENSPAGKAGLRKGDRLVAVAGETITDAPSYMNVARALTPGEVVPLTVMRGGKAQQFQVQVAAAPPPRGQGGARGAPALARFGIVPERNSEGQGVVLRAVRDGTPAAAAGLRAGDRIVAINGKPVADARAYFELMTELGEAEKVELTVERDGKKQQLQAALK
jgi:S1-C subfamily serine protease